MECVNVASLPNIGVVVTAKGNYGAGAIQGTARGWFDFVAQPFWQKYVDGYSWALAACADPLAHPTWWHSWILMSCELTDSDPCEFRSFSWLLIIMIHHDKT